MSEETATLDVSEEIKSLGDQISVGIVLLNAEAGLIRHVEIVQVVYANTVGGVGSFWIITHSGEKVAISVKFLNTQSE